MSRIGKIPITIPAGVEVSVSNKTVNVKGKKGELTQTFNNNMKIEVKDNEVHVITPDNMTKNNTDQGLTRALIANMVEGVSKGFEKKLELTGVGYRANLKGRDLNLQLGYSHPVIVKCPEGITFECPSQTEIFVRGYDKQAVGEVAATIRKKRPPEPYKGKGIFYAGEHIRRKLGKAAKA